MNKMQTYIILK